MWHAALAYLSLTVKWASYRRCQMAHRISMDSGSTSESAMTNPSMGPTAAQSDHNDLVIMTQAVPMALESVAVQNPHVVNSSTESGYGI
jgi:hypothetical protein